MQPLFSTGTEVFVSGGPVYKTPGYRAPPRLVAGIGINIRHRYKNTINERVQYKVRIHGEPLGDDLDYIFEESQCRL
jgi:hypothetical protein